MKKIIMFLVDAMMPAVLESCVAKEKTRALKFLMDHGQYIRDCVTVFPTMTASIDCSIVTGEYPDVHKVPGLVWYDPEEQTIVNYFNGMSPVMAVGLDKCAHNVLYGLNEKHLSKKIKTIYEEIEERGLTAGSINVIAHRGHQYYTPKLPTVLNMATNFCLKEKVSGPSIMSLGKLVSPAIFRQSPWSWAHSAMESLGINDRYAIDVLLEVIKSGKQPDFTFVYLPDNDHMLHKDPAEAESFLEDVDQQFVRFLDSFDSWQQAIERNIILVISDHGQTLIGPTEDHNIPLEQLLADFSIYPLGEELREHHEIVICNNERMTYVYPLHENLQNRIIRSLSSETRIDLIAWKEDKRACVMSTATQQILSFTKQGPYQDCYGQTWSISGNWDVLDLKQDTQGTIWFDNYPDALSRLYGSLFSQEIPLIVITAAPMYEFKSDCSPTHLNGGSHGSLHRQDSLVPLLVVGATQPIRQPVRLIDLKPLILQELTHQTVLV
ncbi:alkaline phosphatase family protein [Brevibacillus ginsengisoli]|uniref:alkaline phosphatase family protein n=1 Tax=Brevibacillus ginsengisoli TaxID=363854 RepID=UPI003CE7BBE2